MDMKIRKTREEVSEKDKPLIKASADDKNDEEISIIESVEPSLPQSQVCNQQIEIHNKVILEELKIDNTSEQTKVESSRSILKDHPQDQVIGDVSQGVRIRGSANILREFISR